MKKFPRLHPTDDLVFKLLFCKDEELLIALLTAVLRPKTPIQRALVLNPEIDRAFVDDKGGALDILVTLDDGTRLDVEMQAARLRTLRPRALFYAAHLITGQLEQGESHDRLRPVISILFLNFKEFSFEHYHEVFHLRGHSSSTPFTDLLEIHTVELPKAVRMAEQGKGGDALTSWCQYFRARHAQEITRLTQEHPMIQKAEERLEEIASDPQARELLRWRKVREKGHRLELGHAFHEGKSEGHAEGHAEGKAEGHVEGHLSGARATLIKLLALKFGNPSPAVLDRIEHATERDLDLWTERILNANQIEEIFEE